MKVNRGLILGTNKFILNCTKANVGTAKTLRVFKEMVGGYSNVGALQIDFKNFRRDLQAYICGADAQLVIDKNLRKKEISPGMTFNYDVDENDQLTRLFWADQTSVRNYGVFGDVVSFDVTYNTNR
ncbi:hypothetical protein DH2020_045598 [Rehmannia glutinosa]|uniref:Protein FAR1-RELATED SEQUENCE n=1 Tax=Rehmannia glutinosa TaxID=99300 RepID=A0ABR0UEE5_REHGL